ncbi:MAG: hypothetical protein IJF42_05625 [Clostridia bacterium]|nr:hypothetical protein [Clostridia bacterium]MBQ7303119.1 hypothetical protein [Clostridia bacterium]
MEKEKKCRSCRTKSLPVFSTTAKNRRFGDFVFFPRFSPKKHFPLFPFFVEWRETLMSRETFHRTFTGFPL